jgi:aminoglycoside phosphotransferase
MMRLKKSKGSLSDKLKKKKDIERTLVVLHKILKISNFLLENGGCAGQELNK